MMIDEWENHLADINIESKSSIDVLNCLGVVKGKQMMAAMMAG